MMVAAKMVEFGYISWWYDMNLKFQGLFQKYKQAKNKRIKIKKNRINLRGIFIF